MTISDQAKPPAKAATGTEPLPIVGIVAETGKEVEPPPPELLEADPALSAEEAEQVRKTIC